MPRTIGRIAIAAALLLGVQVGGEEPDEGHSPWGPCGKLDAMIMAGVRLQIARHLEGLSAAERNKYIDRRFHEIGTRLTMTKTEIQTILDARDEVTDGLDKAELDDLLAELAGQLRSDFVELAYFAELLSAFGIASETVAEEARAGTVENLVTLGCDKRSASLFEVEIVREMGHLRATEGNEPP